MDTLRTAMDRLFPLLSAKALHELHNAIREGLQREDAFLLGKPKLNGFREHGDFKVEADALERELARRGETITKIRW